MPATPSWSPGHVLLVSIGVALMAGLAGSIALAAAADMDPLHAALLTWISLSYSVSGLIAWRRRPANRLGPLMVATGFCALTSSLFRSDNGVAHTIGQALDVLPLIMMVHVFLAEWIYSNSARLLGRIRHRNRTADADLAARLR